MRLYVRRTIHPSVLESREASADLYHNHAKRKDVCFSGVFIAIPENLWCGPPGSIPLHLCYKYGVRPTNNRGEAKIGQTGTTILVDENVVLFKCY